MKTTAERFLEKVNKLETGCWIWTGGKTSKGYGSFHWVEASRPVKAHRASWNLFKSPLRANAWLLHRCNNRLCVNPEHLYIGSPRDNMLDAIACGRIKRTNPQLVIALATKGSSCIEISKVLNITPQAVSKIAQRQGLSVRKLRKQASSQTKVLPQT